jgi:hypothetical protein
MDALSDRIREMLHDNESPPFVHLPACFDARFVPVGDLIHFTSEYGRSIFQQVNHNSHFQDNKRLQVVGTDVPSALRQAYSPINTFVNDLIRRVDSTLRVSPESIIVSLPDCIPQSFHGDYDFDNPASKKSLFILAGLMTSRLHYLEFHAAISISKVLTYNAGDLVVCRGDLIHAGAGYADANVRLHYYVDLPRSRQRTPARKVDKTYIFSDDAGFYEFHYYNMMNNFTNMCTQVQVKRRYHDDHCARMRAAKKALATASLVPLPEDLSADDSR